MVSISDQTRRAIMWLLTALTAFALLSGCTTTAGQSPVWRAVFDSAAEPTVWAPLAGAVVIATTGRDTEISAWASEKTPLFGSRASANEASDRLRSFLRAEAAATSIWVAYRQQGSLTAPLTTIGTSVITEGLTDVIKQGSDRRRPDGKDSLSFPSGHTSSAFAYASLSQGHWQHAGVSATTEQWLRVVNNATAWGVAWARVEAGRHYATDVLVGASLGSFVARTAQRLFLHAADNGDYQLTSHIWPGELHLGAQIRF